LRAVVDCIEVALRLRISGPKGESDEFAAIVDTGYTGDLTLRCEDIERLGLIPLGFRTAILADGQHSVLRMFEATANWDGNDRPVRVLESQGTSLIGMSLLRGFRLTIDIVEDGRFRIESLM